MNKVRIAAVLFAIIAMTAVSGRPKKSETELAMFGPAPLQETGDVSTIECVPVGTNVWTYSPQDIDLYLSASLLPPYIEEGWHSGRARCLKNNGPEGGRLDFYFEDLNSNEVLEEYRLIVRFGTYDRTEDAVLFEFGSMHLYMTAPDTELLKEGYASFSIDFQSCAGDDGGDETATEKGEELCHDTLDNDGDGKVDCADPNCKKWCP